MLPRSYVLRLLVAVAIAASTAACGGPKNPASPAPTSPLGGTQPGSSTGATIVGLVNGGSGVSARTADATSGMTVTVVGTSITAPVDLSGRFELKGVPAGEILLRFTATGIDVKLTLSQVGEQQQIEIRVTITSAGATLDTQQRTGPDNKVELEGQIAAIDKTAKTFVLQEMTVAVTSETVIRHGSTTIPFDDLNVGYRVHVRGTPNGTTVTALEIMVQNQNPVPPGTDTAELHGVVSGLAGSCPTLTFALNSTTVTTTAQTTFRGAGCAQLQDGVKVEVKGLKQADGSVTALMVAAELFEVEGVLSGLSGSCPTVTFTVNGTTVATTVKTAFGGAGCAQLQNGMMVEVKGLKQTGGGVIAVMVTAEFFELRGVVSGLSGSCPTVTFTVNGTTARTTSQTSFMETACAQVQNGMMVEIKGLKQTDGSVTAVTVEAELVKLQGVVSGLSGSCPTLAITVSGSAVTTTVQTVYVKGSCSDIKANTALDLKGLKQADNSLIASWIKFD